MARSSNLSSDIDFIKEFEELRLKQRILIETLNRQKSSKEKELVHEINTKLDFLVNIFKDTAENAEFNEKEYLDSHFEALNKQLDGMKEHMEHSFADLYSKVEEFQSQASTPSIESKNEDSKKEEIKTSEVKSPPPPETKKEVEASDKKEENISKELPKEKVQASTPPNAAPTSDTPISSGDKKEEDSSQQKASTTPPAPDFKVSAEEGKGSEKKKKGWF